jgi:hypothetical protein
MRLNQTAFDTFARGSLLALGDLTETVTYTHKQTPSSTATIYPGLSAYVSNYDDRAVRENPGLATSRRMRIAKADMRTVLGSEDGPSRFGTILRADDTTWQIVLVTGDHAFHILQIQQRG